MVYSLLCFFFWGVADLFYKKSNNEKDKYSDIKTAIVVGIIMGISALIVLVNKRSDLDLSNYMHYIKSIIKYLPISFCYIFSMFIGYKGLKYIELSIASPVQNTSGVITSLLLVLFFREVLPYGAYIAFILIFVGILGVSLLEKKDNKTIKITKNNKVLAIVLPIIYCILDGLGTFLDSVYIDKYEIISEEAALVCYEFTFLIVAIALILFLLKKHEKLPIKNSISMWSAAIFETIGQYFYVYAIGANSTIATSIVGSYCILSMILSSIFLKEKLTIPKYAFLFLAVIGIVILAILDI